MTENSKKRKKNAFFCKKIWSCQKFVVLLHPRLRNNVSVHNFWAFSSAGLERLPYKQRVCGSNP